MFGALKKQIAFLAHLTSSVSLALDSLPTLEQTPKHGKSHRRESRSLTFHIDAANGKRGTIVLDEVFRTPQSPIWRFIFALRYRLVLLFLSLPCAKGGGKIFDFDGGIVGVRTG